MTDSFAREITYARVSLTDRCNLPGDFLCGKTAQNRV